MSQSGWPCARASVHRRRHANSQHQHQHHRRRRSRYRAAPSTPLLRWNSKLHANANANANGAGASSSSAAAKPAGAAASLTLSSRKLAAGLWHLRFSEISAAEAVPCDRLAPQIESSLPYPNCAVERAAKGNSGRSKASGDDDVYYVFSHQKILRSKRVTGVAALVTELQAELAQARSRICKLEAKKQSLRKKVKHLLDKLEEERIPRRRREEQKSNEAIDELRDGLIRERKSRRRMEILNTKLVNQLGEVNLSVEQLMQDYEEEKKSRELVEEVCDKLVQRIGEDKAEVERMRREYMRIGKELEEERNMMQLAEVWREERVQMKLVDAKLALEDKFAMMNSLITELENVLRSASCSLDDVDLRKAEKILQAAAKSLTIKDVVDDFTYVPPKPDDMFSVLRELRECEGNEREIGPCNSQTWSSHDSNIASPEIKGLDKSHRLTFSNCLSEYNSALGEDAGICDSASRVGYQSSSHPPEGRKDNAGQCSPISPEMSEVSASIDKVKHNVTPVSSIRGSKPSDSRYNMVPKDGDDRKLSNGTISSAETPSPVRQWGKTEPMHHCQRISAGLENPHIARGMKGCIEWPRAIQKNVLRAKISEAIIQNQKSQLRHILKPKT